MSRPAVLRDRVAGGAVPLRQSKSMMRCYFGRHLEILRPRHFLTAFRRRGQGGGLAGHRGCARALLRRLPAEPADPHLPILQTVPAPTPRIMATTPASPPGELAAPGPMASARRLRLGVEPGRGVLLAEQALSGLEAALRAFYLVLPNPTPRNVDARAAVFLAEALHSEQVPILKVDLHDGFQAGLHAIF
eukprot:CAMPEP_0180439590 /NCGR_PEP_ID=MMETSP1036_2-20121128/12668_1 /TAXON_ID=632150 /ORGANISM="Azadinium spinosum, Strain 3D9" /LENGTH=189 /DNA_ID=CAMNT_0022445737 /DNA_START=700 /DNA_END=1266 /DNA_ORIENTATION=-